MHNPRTFQTLPDTDVGRDFAAELRAAGKSLMSLDPEADLTLLHDAAAEIDRLHSLLRHHGVSPMSEFICSCGRRQSQKTEPYF